MKILGILPNQTDQDLYSRYTNALKLARLSPETINQIGKDIKRTFSANNYFNSKNNNTGFVRLERLLTAISTFRDIGYVQGINYIAASLLWHCEEHISYYILSTLFERLEANRNYTSDLSGIISSIEYFYNNFLKTNATDIYENLQDKEVVPEMIFPEWIVTLGTCRVPLQFHVFIFYNLLQQNWGNLYHIMRNYLRFMYPYYKDEDFATTILIIKNAEFENGDRIDVDWKLILGLC